MKYERLTKRELDYVFDNCCSCEYYSNPNGCTEHCCYEVMKNRLAELEDKIEQGKLIELPCKVGDKVYVVYRFPDCWEEPDCEYDIFVETVHDIIITEEGFDIGTESRMIGKVERLCVCVTREEAEKKLKELQK